MNEESGWNFKLRFNPSYSDENVPIPESAPIDTNGYCVMKVLLLSWVIKIWCKALVSPIDTLTILLTVVSFEVVNPAITPVEAILTKLDSNLAEFSEPSGWSCSLNLNVPIPDVVLPKPTIFDLTKIELGLSFSKSKDKILELRFEVNVPIEELVFVSKE